MKRDLEDSDTKGVDMTITPSSIRTKEQEVEELKRKTDEIERKVAADAIPAYGRSTILPANGVR